MNNIVFADAIWTNTKIHPMIKNIILVLTGSWLIALMAQLSVTLPWTPIPVTGQTFGVLLISCLLGARRGFRSVFAYLLQGGMGLPFFAGGASGAAIFTKPSAGYLFGFLIASIIIGYFADKNKDRSFKSALPSFLIGYSLIYICGVTWLSYWVGLENAIYLGVVPFLPLTFLKLITLSWLFPTLWKFKSKLNKLS
jgi:biotin transport system substrate-specific component